MIKIKRIRVNFQIRFGYNPELTNYIKTLPKDQISTHMQPIDIGGQTIEDWFRICNIAGLSKVLWYCWENNITVQYENIKSSDIERIENFAKKKKNIIDATTSFKIKPPNISAVDYSFMKLEPFQYQKEAVAFFEAANGNALLGDQPGVGKTLSAIAYAAKCKYKTLVVCPASLKYNVWKKEVIRFTDIKPYVFKHKKLKKEVADNPDDCLIHIINYEALDTYLKFDYSHKCSNQFCNWEEVNRNKKYKICPKCFKDKSIKSRITDLCHLTDDKGVELNISVYDMIILDEAHYIKNEAAGRTKIIKHAFSEVPRKILLTGTAIKSRPYEFFSLLNFLDKHEWISAHNYGIRYCDGKKDNYDHWHYDGYSNIEELYQRISYLFLRRLKEDVLKFLPPKTYTNIVLELSPEEGRVYRQLEKGILDETQETDEKMTHLARIQKLKQFTSMHCARNAIEFIQNIIDGDLKVVVFSQFIATADYIHNYFKECSVLFNGKKTDKEKDEAVSSFMTDENCKVFVGTIGAAGVGITLTAANTVVFLDQPWTPSDREQAEDRVHRASQEANNVQVIRLICQGTIDEDIDNLLNEKEKITSQVLDNIKSENKVQYSIFNEIVEILLNKKAA